MQADYSQQLTEIAAALRESTPLWKNPWILAGLSAMLGVIGGFVGQILQTMYQRRTVRRTLLRIGYGYVGQLLAALDVMASSPKYSEHHQEAMGIVLPTIPEDYVRTHLDVYAELDESPVFDSVFGLGRKLLAPPGDYDFVNATIQAIVLHFVAGRLTVEKVREYRNQEEAETLKVMLAKYEPPVKKLYASS